jgi:hypothetical protein
MPVSELRLIKRCAEYIDKKDFKDLKKGLRGIYVLFKEKSKYWTHFSVFEVWDNISDAEIEELEGLFRHFYKRDSKANKLNKQKGYQKMFKVKINNLEER